MLEMASKPSEARVKERIPSQSLQEEAGLTTP